MSESPIVDIRLLQTAIAVETDIVLVRRRTRRLAELLGFDRQEQTRVTTAVSEIARNAFEYAGGGQVDFRILTSRARQQFVIAVRDKGPGITEIDAILAGMHTSRTGMGIGLIGAQRLMDEFDIETAPGAGTTVRLVKYLPRGADPLTAASVRRVVDALAADGPPDAMEEIRQQNQLILLQMQELRLRQEDLEKLNQELQDTNRGVVALYAELDERADHLRRADELKSRFLSHMSHEFRTPLNSILALSRLLLSRNDGDLTNEQDRQVRFIHKAAEDLTELVNDLLDLAKVEAGKTEIAASVFTVDGLFGTLRGMLRPLLSSDAVALVFENAASLPPLHTDEGKVSQILRNFISNAIKYTERGEVRVWASTDPPGGNRVGPGVGSAVGSAPGSTVTFHVRDTGIGIAPDDIELIFQEFGQVTNRLQGRVKGTGLGLPLARKLAELLGGRIDVESTPGAGSTFAVTIPCVYAAEAEIETIPSWDVEADKLPVLLLEDNPTDAFVVDRILSGSPYQLFHVRTVPEARVALDRLHPAAIILDAPYPADTLDTQHPSDERWRFLSALREDDRQASVPVIVTSPADEPRAAPHPAAGACLSKPLEAQALLDVLHRLTGRRAATKVLLVDDEEVARYLVGQLLPRSRYSLRTAISGRQGLELLGVERPDIILLDLNMPGMSGFEFLSRVRASPGLSTIPVIIITSAFLGADDRHRLRDVAGVIAKSHLSAAALDAAIQSALGPPVAAVAE